MTSESRRIRPTLEEMQSATLIAADDGTVFRCTLRSVGTERQRWRWIFTMLTGPERNEYIGPPWFDASPIELVAIVNEWWTSRKAFNAGESVEQLRNRIAQDMARDN